MKILIFGDVHGNLPAFEKMLKAEGNCDAYVCLGDLVNYGPWSNECVDLALTLHNCVYLKGNHEEAFIKGHYPGANELVQSFFNTCMNDFDRTDQIRKFQEKYLAFDYCFCHTIQESYIYPDTSVKLDSNYVIGHSHHQFVYQNSGFTLYNAGSVGQNREYIDVINYLTLESRTMEFRMCALPYNVQEIIQVMRSKGYPLNCIEYYTNKPTSKQ